MTEQVTFVQRARALLRPAYVLIPSVWYFVFTLVTQPHIFLGQGLGAVRSASFAKFWLAYGYTLSKDISPTILALLSTVRGTVLDIGPGTGDLLGNFDATKVRICYGVEPSVNLHEQLHMAAKQAGFAKPGNGRYVVLEAGAEPLSLLPALDKAGFTAEDLSKGIFDEIVCVSSLCSVPTPVETCQELYRLLKPGGRLVVYEHVLNQYDALARALQTLYMLLGWKYWVGGCCLDRDTQRTLLDAAGPGGWKETHLDVLFTYGAIPCIVGYLIKKS